MDIAPQARHIAVDITMRFFMSAMILVLSSPPGQAKTCFHACVAPKLTSSTMQDAAIRDVMKACRNSCEAETAALLKANGTFSALDACDPEPVPDADMKLVRGASSSFQLVASNFIWDVQNVLPGKIIRRVEMIMQNIDLQDVVMSSRGTVLPGERATLLFSAVNDGYPAAAVTARIKAIYTCPAK